MSFPLLMILPVALAKTAPALELSELFRLMLPPKILISPTVEKALGSVISAVFVVLPIVKLEKTELAVKFAVRPFKKVLPFDKRLREPVVSMLP